ncbi:Extracellular matrix-binding ebh, putative [Babesia ovata]|uniref:Extracellular matrix-binding ebh, putative n=1 Tax=Babesia ovata TaxID=189622 RepID=A0A2H6K8U6_9APIC|nr:Extracellular matrix-binding ebh, putative [Babesia ovata]GBE59432.1 Extracellular matrix-binding ebh, putative [Babesia ovata]
MRVAVICDHIVAINTANDTLLHHVTNLNTWITDAEKIRAAAEQKAKEAYDKLKVNEALDKNVKLIVGAKDKINEVHGNLGKVHGTLGEWNKQASTVLEEAIRQAEDVYYKLDEKSTKEVIGLKLGEIETAKGKIEQGNSELKNEVDNLGQWKTAAGEVIDKANGKCEEILKKVGKDKPEGKIFLQAEELKKKGIELFTAAQSAKSLVEQKVTKALEAVVEMDASLKKDLKSVKEEIKRGIKEVITELEVEKLDEKVRDDLTTLKENIEKLTEDDNATKSLVNGQLEVLKREKSTLDLTTSKEHGSIQRAVNGLDSNFDNHIQTPLSQKVGEVDKAIEGLGGTFDGLSGENAKKLEKILDHIKGEVEKIKGQAGENNWHNSGGSGLEGIKSKVQDYFNAFSGSGQFDKIVNGWLQGILGKQGQRVVEWFKEWTDDHVNDVRPTGKRVLGNDITFDKIIDHLKKQLHGEAKAAGGVVEQGKSTDNITANIEAVKKGCEKFVESIDEKLKKQQISTLLQAVKKEVVGKIVKLKKGKDEDIDEVLKTILVALRSTSNQVSEELNSVFLNITDDGDPSPGSIASILDTITPIATDLNNKLTQATEKSGSPPVSGQPESPAQAVDSKLGEVKERKRAMKEEDGLR